MKTATTILGILTVVISISLASANPVLAANFQGGEGHSGGGVHGGVGRSSSGMHRSGNFRAASSFRDRAGFRGGGHRFYGYWHGGGRGFAVGIYGAPYCYSYPTCYAAPCYTYPYNYGYYDYSVAAPAADESLTDSPPPPSVLPEQNQASVAPVQSPIAAPEAPETSVTDIEAMSKAAVNDTIIIGQIHQSHSVYHLSATDIIDLKNNGVSQHVIEFMVNTPSS